MRFEHGQSRYSRYARVSRAQRGRLVIYAVLLVAVVAAMIALRNRGRPTGQQQKTGPIEWLVTFEEATARAQADGKLIMAFFYVEGNENCRRMELETFADETIRAEAGNFVCVRVHGEVYPDLVKRYYVLTYPAVAFISPGGEPLPVIFDYRTPGNFLNEMGRALDRWKRGSLTESPSLPPKSAEPSRGEAE